MKKSNDKRKYIFVTTTVGIAVILVVWLLSLIIPASAIGYKSGIPQHELYRIFQMDESRNSNVEYVNEDGVIFVVFSDENGRSRYAHLVKNKDGNYTDDIEELISVGASMSGLGFNAYIDGATLFTGDGKYVFFVPIAGYPFDETDASPIIDIEKVNVYDATGDALAYVSGNNLRLYYYVNETLPNNFKVYMDYEGKEYTLLDSNIRVAIK